jgi:hypothetical protein
MPDIYIFGSMVIGLGLIGLSICLGPRCCIYPYFDNNIISLTHNLCFEKVYEHENVHDNDNVSINNTIEELKPILS